MILYLRLAAIIWGIVVAVLAGCLCLFLCVAIFGVYFRIENNAVITMQYAASALAGTVSGMRAAKGKWPKQGASSDELLTAVRRRFPNSAVLTIGLHLLALIIFALPILPLLILGGPKPGLNYPNLGPYISQLVWLVVLVFDGMSTLVCVTMAFPDRDDPVDKHTERSIVAWSLFVLALNTSYIVFGIWPKN